MENERANLLAQRERLQKTRDTLLFNATKAADPSEVQELNRKIGALTVRIEKLKA